MLRRVSDQAGSGGTKYLRPTLSYDGGKKNHQLPVRMAGVFLDYNRRIVHIDWR
jgi:hypothetical protein